MGNPTLLDIISEDSYGKPQSFLEGVFNPEAPYHVISNITNGILGPLSNDDTRAMRRTNSAMNDHLMARRADGSFFHKQEAMRDKCDVVGLSSLHPNDGCPNPVGTYQCLRRCTRGKNEPGFYGGKPVDKLHRGIKDFLVCWGCHQNSLYHRDCMDKSFQYKSKWRPCIVCCNREESKYPQGAQFCQCTQHFENRVLCLHCVKARIRYLNRETRKRIKQRHTVWRDGGVVKFGHDPPSEFPVCLGCGVRPSDLDPDNPRKRRGYMEGYTTICLFCRKYNIAPTEYPTPVLSDHSSASLPFELTPPDFSTPAPSDHPSSSASPTVQKPPSPRRSTRLNPTETDFSTPVPSDHPSSSASPIVQQPPSPRRSARLNNPTETRALLRLSYRGSVQKPTTETQNRHGFMKTNPRRRKTSTRK